MGPGGNGGEEGLLLALPALAEAVVVEVKGEGDAGHAMQRHEVGHAVGAGPVVVLHGQPRPAGGAQPVKGPRKAGHCLGLVAIHPAHLHRNVGISILEGSPLSLLSQG